MGTVISSLNSIFLQLDASYYAWEIVVIIVTSIISLGFFFIYWGYIRTRPIVYPTPTLNPVAEQIAARREEIAARASAHYQNVMASVMQNLPKNLQMRQCSKCGSYLRPQAEFCDKCGAKVVTPSFDKTTLHDPHRISGIS